MLKLYRILLLLPAVFFSACREEPVSVVIRGGGASSERAFVEAALNKGAGALGLSFVPGGTDDDGENPEGSVVVVELLSSWEFENAWGDILVSKTWYVPAADPGESGFAQDLPLEACLDGSRKLVPLEELAPPFTAARVDGLAVSDAAYPLVRTGGIKVEAGGSGKKAGKTGEAAAGLEAYLRGLAKPLAGEAPSLVWIAAAGDLMLGRGAGEILLREGPPGLFGGAAEILAAADIALVNLEGPVSIRGEKAAKTFAFRFDPRSARALAGTGIDAVLFANNHAFDYGGDAFIDSLSLLKEAGVGIVGAGMDEDEAGRPWVFTKGGFTARVFGIASFFREASGWDGAAAAAGPGRPGILRADGADKIRAAFNGGEVVDILLFHGGEEWSRRPDGGTRALYTGLVESGADLVIGSHPHIVQDFEWVSGKPVFWSLGNFVFAGMEETGGGDRGLLVRLGYLGSKLVYLERFPLLLTGPRTELTGQTLR
jgi:poly-gamma-glutamate synthesis protein (capsule biosynthesis protein)